MNLDALVFAAHPDDAELGMGGTIAKFTKNNFSVGIIDITQGEMGTRGSSDTRKKEALKAALILKTRKRCCRFCAIPMPIPPACISSGNPPAMPSNVRENK